MKSIVPHGDKFPVHTIDNDQFPSMILFVNEPQLTRLDNKSIKGTLNWVNGRDGDKTRGSSTQKACLPAP